MSLNTLEVCTCPKCGATCVIGNDDDMQQFCAKCYHTFIPEETRHVDFTEMVRAKERYSHVGWEAFIPKEK